MNMLEKEKTTEHQLTRQQGEFFDQLSSPNSEKKKKIFSMMLLKHAEMYPDDQFSTLTINLLTTTIVGPPNNASKWQMGFN